jgi:hypothetical protein
MSRNVFVSSTARALSLIAACLVIACMASCMWGDRGYPPTSNPNYIPSPPRYVRIVEWLRPNYFAAEYYYESFRVKLSSDTFIIIDREETAIALGDGWFAPDWSRKGVLPALTADELALLKDMEKLWPPGSIVELEYPVASGEEKKIGRHDEVRLDRRLVAKYNGYVIVIKGMAPETIIIPEGDERD